MSLTVTMIGCSSTGKTCYLYGTYAGMLEGISHFHFTPEDYNQGLELEEAWESILDDGRWPPGNAKSEDYVFNCLYHGKRIGTFTWQDYRGGILQERNDDDAPEDVRKLHQRCRHTDALLVCIPADVLLKACQGDMRSDRMLSRYLRVLGGVPDLADVPVVLVVTKKDLIGTRDELQQCFRHLLKKFSILLTDHHKALMIVPVSLGRFRGIMEQNGEVDGEIDPENLHLPILFPMYLEFSEIAHDFRTSGNAHSRRSGWEKFWHGDNSAHYYEEARKMEETTDAIWEQFEGAVDIYQNGESILNSSGVVPVR